jgi:Putative amidoligase enzyme
MDIKELHDYRLSDAIKFHTQLNPRIWGRDEHLLPEVREKLLAIAADFKEFLGLDLEVADITISGSNAAYTYTDHSDIDLHLVADLPKADASEIYRELFDAKKYQYNDQHTFKIGGYDVELYVQNANEDPKSQGIYSVLDNKWISVPKRRKPEVDDISVKSKYEDLGRRIEAAIQSGDAAQLEMLGKKVREFRQAGLDKTGEFGPENLAFKILRSNGTLDQLRAARLAARDRELSIDEAKKKKSKKKTRYGFGGVFFPGYHYYGQTDAAVDGGGESVKESADSVDTQLQNFVKFCADKLELEQIPRIQIKRDPAWSKRNNSFGRYIPDADTLIVSVANRHPMDVMRTMAHELTHRKQDEQADMPIGAGDTGSDWENQANALAGVLMRDFAELHPEYFGKEPISEASGYVPVNKKEARDPRYSMAVTVDIKPGEPQRQAAKMGWKTNPAGTPPTARTNGLVEALTRKLQAVKEGSGFPLVNEQEQELEEVAMSPSALRSFANSEAAAGMRAGFEAELVFTGIGGDEEEGEWEPDYSYDPRAYSLENIEDFFSSGDFAEGLSRRQKNALEEDWMDWYDQTLYDEFDAPVAVREWIQENDWDEEDLIERALDDEYSEDRVKEILAAMERRVNGTGTAADADLVEEYVGARQEVERQLDERVDLAIEEHNSDYESALDEFRENWDRDESDWLRDRGWTNMSDLAYNFDFTWPHLTMSGGSYEGGFNEEAAQQLADSLSETLGVETTVSTGYHSARRDASTWIFEPDGSLEADDDANMPVEIVSPPMPLSKTLEILPKFFEWAEANGAYANSSTGFHMSVSMPEHEGNMLDYTKLALFLGDEYVLKQFGREANTYAKSALKKIREKKGSVDDEEILSTMRKHLNQFASRALAQPSGFGKYTSINPKNNYIEFRSAGGSNYFEDMEKIQNTLMRYARAMNIAFDPAADKPEYAKKLYKLLTDTKTQQVTDPKTGTKRTEVVPSKDNDAISIFSRYVAGELPKSELKGFLKKLQYGREAERQAGEGKPVEWQVTAGAAGMKVVAASEMEAKLEASREWNIDPNSPTFDSIRAVPSAPATQTPATDQLNAPAADDPAGNYVLRRREGNEGTGPVVYRFSAPNNMAAVEAARRWTTARGLDRRSVWLDHISGVPPEVLNARPVQATLGEPRPAFTEPRSNSIPEVPLDIAQNFSPIQTEPQNFPAARQTGGEFSGEWKVVDGLGREVHRFSGIGNAQSDANRVAREWAQSTGFDGNLEVYPVMR